VSIHHTGRCGSTLLSQAFARLPKTLVLSDPFCQTIASSTYLRGKISRRATGKIMCDIVRLQSKPLKEVKNVLLKVNIRKNILDNFTINIITFN